MVILIYNLNVIYTAAISHVFIKLYMFALTLISEILWIYPSFSAMRSFGGDLHPALIRV